MFPRRRQLGGEEEEEAGQRRKSGHTYVHRSTGKINRLATEKLTSVPAGGVRTVLHHGAISQL